MQKAIAILMDEHRRIEQVLGSLESFAAAVSGGLAAERRVVAGYAAFFRGFADACHHGKEEGILFARMIEHGFSRESGPVAAMLYEHEVGRGHVAALRCVAEGTGAMSVVDGQGVVGEAGAFVPLLRAHIVKEDRILYPMALRVLSGPELDEMEEGFAAFERTLRQDGTYDRLQQQADGLLAAFPPDPVAMAMASEAGGCGAR